MTRTVKINPTNGRRATRLALALICGVAAMSATAGCAQSATPTTEPAAPETVSQKPNTSGSRDLIDTAEQFFGDVSHGIAEAIEKVVAKRGTPSGYIVGEEVSGGFVGGVRYGSGTLVFTNSRGEAVRQRVYWQGPTLGFDVGANASKVFVLVYNLKTLDDIYGRRPMAQAGIYVGAGGDVAVDHRKDVTLVPVMSGVGARAGVRVGYVRITPKRRWFPL